MTPISQIFLCFLAVSSVAIDEKEYCNRTCDSEPHILCVLKGKCNPTSNNALLTESEKKHLLSRHNDMRHWVAIGGETRGLNGTAQPSASNMRTFEWSDELEFIAQCQVNQCTTPTTNCLNKHDGTYVQQIVWVSTSVDIDANLNESYNKVENFDPVLIPKFHSVNDVDDYIKIVWADTREIGCARALCTSENTSVYVTACNYAPGGIVKGVPVYKIGKPCADCPKGTACRSKDLYGLCSRIRKAEEDIPKNSIPHSSATAVIFNQITLKIFVTAQSGMYLYWNY